jgi:polyphosphate glucokinase
MKVLVVDIGGTTVKMLATGQVEPQKFHSGPKMTPEEMASQVKQLAATWKYDVVSIGYPGLILEERIAAEPRNLAHGWIGFDFEGAFKCPVKLLNDAAMQALGSYESGTMLFLGLGTGLGSALVVEGHLVPMELGHLSHRNKTVEYYLGDQGLKRLGREEWQRQVELAVARLIAALHPDDVVIGGGNAKNLKRLPPGCREGRNANAFLGGFRMWAQ